jgi:hypothetical protein
MYPELTQEQAHEVASVVEKHVKSKARVSAFTAHRATAASAACVSP